MSQPSRNDNQRRYADVRNRRRMLKRPMIGGVAAPAVHEEQIGPGRRVAHGLGGAERICDEDRGTPAA
jgi:hypothetical protein